MKQKRKIGTLGLLLIVVVSLSLTAIAVAVLSNRQTGTVTIAATALSISPATWTETSAVGMMFWHNLTVTSNVDQGITVTLAWTISGTLAPFDMTLVGPQGAIGFSAAPSGIIASEPPRLWAAHEVQARSYQFTFYRSGSYTVSLEAVG